MNTALGFSNENKFLKNNDYRLIKKHLENSKLPHNIKNYFSSKDVNKILSFMIKDKKNNTDKINLVLLKKIGRPTIENQYNKNYLKSFLKNQLMN